MKKGFTLIELLAVIIIIAIVALISTPIVLNVIDDVRKSAYNSSARFVVEGARYYYSESLLSNKEGIDGKTNLFNEITKNMQGKMPDSGEIYINEKGQVAISLVYNKTCYIKDFRTSDLIESEDYENCKVTYTDIALKGADPELDKGMIPVVIASDGSLTKADLRTKWYDYESKEWANAVLVSDATRESYMNANAGTSINLNDVMAYYVWIPRYRYQIFTDISNVSNSKSLASIEEYENKAQEIQIEFEDKETEKVNGTEKEEWLTHPAFTFGDKELNGIWVGKFETTGTASVPTVLPSVASLRGQNVSTQFLTSQKINYGLDSKEASMLKNSEWGAIAYLTNSKYGRCNNGVCEEVERNNNSSYLTGYSAVNKATLGHSSTSIEGNEYGTSSSITMAYNTTVGYKASTTGNITGIYDMSGGAEEYVMGVMEDSLNSKVPTSGRNNTYNSGFTGNFTCPTCESQTATSITGVSFPDSKYYDIYTYGTSYIDANAYKRGQLGDATVELEGFANWIDPDGKRRYHNGFYMDYAYFVYYGLPWFERGGVWHAGVSAGVFAFDHNSGLAYGHISFRSVLR